MTALFFRYFYASLLFLDCNVFTELLRPGTVDGADWLWPVLWIPWLQNPQATVVAVFAALCFIHASSILRPESRTLRALGVVLLFLMMAIKNSAGRSDQVMQGYLFASATLALANGNPVKDAFYLRAAQIFAVLPYCFAGIWKAFRFGHSLSELGWSGVNPLIANIQWAEIQRFQAPVMSNLFEAYPSTSRALWVLVILFEVSAPLFVFFPRWHLRLGIAIILFHGATNILLGIPYIGASLLAAVLFCGSPFVERLTGRQET